MSEDLQYGLRRVGVATRELALCVVMCVVVKPRQMFEGTTSLLSNAESEGTNASLNARAKARIDKNERAGIWAA